MMPVCSTSTPGLHLVVTVQVFKFVVQIAGAAGPVNHLSDDQQPRVSACTAIHPKV